MRKWLRTHLSAAEVEGRYNSARRLSSLLANIHHGRVKKRMKREKILMIAATSVVLLALSALNGWSQGYTGGIKGQVTKNSEPVKGLQVICTDPNTGRQYKTKTDKNGEFTVVGLQPGNYVIEVLSDKKEVLFHKNDGVQADMNNEGTIELTRPEASGGTA